MIHYKDTDLAYIAGIVDGEGTVGVTKVKRPENRCGYSFLPLLSIINTDRAMLEYINDIFGGISTISERNGGNTFNIKQNKTCYCIFSRRTEKNNKILTAIYPYMRIKKKNADNVFELMRLKGESKNYATAENLKKQFSCYLKARALNGTILTEEDIRKLTPDWSKMNK